MNIDLTSRILKKKKAGKIGRYSVSDVYSLLNGYLTPLQYLTGNRPPFIDELTDSFTMWQGSGKHLQIQSLFPECPQEEKKETKIDDFTLVAKYDIRAGNEIWELKTSTEVMREAKKAAIYQLKLYLTIFECPIGRVFQPVYEKEDIEKFGRRERIKKFYLKELGVVERDDAWFKKQMEKMDKIHKEIKKVATLQECVQGCQSFDEFCEKCNGLLSKSDRIAKEVWDEYVASTK